MAEPAQRYEPVIGLEIHVQLKTQTKMFCSCPLSFGEQPNVNTCPVCLGHPGTLPVLNRQAVINGLMLAQALECEIAPRSIFHRKNYFYPDLPKGYQISQYDIPLARGGKLDGVRIHRVHLEEDAAKLVHESSSGRIHGSGTSIVDFNRGGTPLVEIVTEPDISTPAQAKEWLQLLRVTLKTIGVSDVNMEEGSLRCDANVSIRPVGESELGTKTELKNMNSFRFLERGLEAEIERQREVVAGGGLIVQETLHFDPATGELKTLRSKEEAHDYRYFPEPDLVPLEPTDEMLEQARQVLPELPAARLERYGTELPAEAAETLAFSGEGLGDYYDEACEATGDMSRTALANFLIGPATSIVREQGYDGLTQVENVSPTTTASVVSLVSRGEISTTAAREVFSVMVKQGGEPEEIVEQRGLKAIGAGPELEEIVERAIKANPDAAEQFRAGKERAIGRITGAVMKETKGRADGKAVDALIREKLGQ